MERINCWLARVKIAHKLILSGAVFALPIAVQLYYVTTGYNRGIRACEREVKGAAALKICPVLLRDLRRLESRANLASRGGPIPPGDPEEMLKRVDNAVVTLQGAEGDGTKELVVRLRARWRQLQERSPTMPAQDQAAAFHQLVETTSQLVPVILDDSSLILDPDLRTYHLMNVTGPLLLQAQAAVTEAGAVAWRSKAAGRKMDSRDLSQLNAQSGALLSTIIPRMRYSLETSLRDDRLRHGANSSFQKSVPPLFERYVQGITDLSSSISRAAEETNADLAPDRIAEMAEAADDAGVSLGSTAVDELRALLLRRITDDKRSRSIALLLSLICVALAVGVTVIVTRNITRPLNFVVNLTTDIAAGRVRKAFARVQSGESRDFLPDDGGPAQTKDETCQLIRSVSAMTESLNTLLVKVAQAGNKVAGSATQMAAAVCQVEAAVSEQAASTNQVSATSKEIYATAQDLARTMAGVTRMAKEAGETARGGVSNLDGIRSAIDELIHASAAMTQTFDAINEKTRNIDEIVAAITKVANRTNLLSLNAAIEAEKAGEKAGGFSVVAVEMRRLADQTAVAALDIEKQIREVQIAVRDGVSSVESYAGQTQAKSRAVTELSSGLGHVIEGTTKLGPEIEAVNNGMQMQSQGAGQIAEAMQQLRDAAGQTKDSLAEFRQVAEDLDSAVGDLQAEVGRFSTAS